MASDEQDGSETITTTIEVDKELFLRFKALCVLKELTISGEIENMIRKRTKELDELMEQGRQ